MQGLIINLVSDTIDPNSYSQTCCVLSDGSQSQAELKVQIWFLLQSHGHRVPERQWLSANTENMSLLSDILLA